MGEIADLMIDGTLCGVCGVLLPGAAYGAPRYCPGCQPRGQRRKKRKKKK